MRFSRRQENLIALFRGLPGLPTKGKPRELKGIDSVMDKIIQANRILEPRIENEIRDQWAYIVGEHNAARCHPQRIANGTVYAICDNPSLVADLNFSRRMILRRLHSACPSLKNIRFVVG